MQTIVRPRPLVDKLWGKQRVKEDKSFRLMKYVLRVDHEGQVLLHNVITGQLVVVDQEERKVLDKLPTAFSLVMEQLVAGHYLVPEDYDEHQQAVNLRKILWKVVDANSPKNIIYYTILPTTACNARCWYCYEKGVKPFTMTEEVANGVVDFIERSCGGSPITIRWFGGEPTLATERIDQISKGLLERGIEYKSNVTTNGYLFDEEMAIKAKNLWHTNQVNISIDGTEETYNRVKAFPGVKDNPYQRMMNNAKILMKHDIDVVIRMNYDQDTWEDFPKLVQETKERFRNYQRWMLHPHQINRDLPPGLQSEMEKWLSLKNAELFDLVSACGLYQKPQKLPSLEFSMCQAGNDGCTTILPDGNLVFCPEQIGADQVKGNIYQGTTNPKLTASWKEFADYERCRDCPLFPYCSRMKSCSARDRCSGKLLFFKRVNEEIIKRYESAVN